MEGLSRLRRCYVKARTTTRLLPQPHGFEGRTRAALIEPVFDVVLPLPRHGPAQTDQTVSWRVAPLLLIAPATHEDATASGRKKLALGWLRDT